MSARWRAAICEVYEMSADALRQVLNQCPVMSDIILQAFIARRQLLRESPEFHRAAGDRVALLAGYVPGARFPGQESRSVHLDRSRDRSQCGPAAQAIRRHRGGHPGGGFRQHAAAAQPVEPASSPTPSASASRWKTGALRPGGGGRRTGGTGGGGLRRVAKACRRRCWSIPRRAGRRAAACGSKTTWASPPDLTGSELAGRAILQANKFGVASCRCRAA